MANKKKGRWINGSWIGVGWDATEGWNNTTNFLPTDISGCVLWLDSRFGLTKDANEDISNHKDLSSNGHDAYYDGVIGTKPRWVTSDQSVYWQGIGGSDPGEDFLQITNPLTLNDLTVFFRHKPKLDATYAGFALGDHGVLDSVDVQAGTSLARMVISEASIMSVNIGSLSSDWFNICFVRNQGGNFSVYLNGALKGTVASLGGAFHIKSLNGPLGPEHSGWNKQIIIYNRILSEKELQDVFKFLNM